MATKSIDDEIDSLGKGSEDESHPRDSEIDALGTPEPAQAQAASVAVQPADPQLEAAESMGLSPVVGEQATLGAVRGAADIGNTALNALDVPAQWLENKFGVPFGPSVAQARALRDKTSKDFEESGHSKLAQASRIGAQVALTAPLIAETSTALLGMPRVAQALQFLSKTRAGRFVENNLVGRSAKRAVTGAAIGGEAAALASGQSDEPVGDQVERGMLVGAATNPILEPLVVGAVSKGKEVFDWLKSLGSKVFRSEGEAAPNALTGSTGDAVGDALKQVGHDYGTLTPEIEKSMQKEGADQLAKTGAVDADSLARKANMESLGLKVHSSMVTQDPLAWAAEREFAKTPAGAKLQEDYIKNNQTLVENLDKLADSYGGQAATADDAAESLMGAAAKKKDLLEEQESQLWNDIETKHGQKSGIKPDRLLKTVKQSQSRALSEPGQGPGQGLLASVKARLSDLGVITKDGKAVLLKSGKPKTLTVSQAKALRTFIRKSSAPSENMQAIKRDLLESVDTSVERAVGEDVFKPAREFTRSIKAEFDDKNEASRLIQEAVGGKASPQGFIDRYVFGKSGDYRDLQKAVNSLTTGPNAEAGVQAINDVRSTMLEKIRDSSKLNNGTLSYDKLTKNLVRIGPKRLKILFGDDGAQKLTRIQAGLRDSTVTPEGAPVNWSNSGNEIVRRVSNMLEKGEPGNKVTNMLERATQGGTLAAMLTSEPNLMFMRGGAVAMKKVAENLDKRTAAKVVNQIRSGSAVPEEVKRTLAQDPGINRLVSSTTVPATVAGVNQLNRKR